MKKYHQVIYVVADDAIHRLLSYDRHRYEMDNGWSIRFRVRIAPLTTGRPHGIKYSLTLHDAQGRRLLGFDNAHGIPRASAYDHQHGFRSAGAPHTYEYRSGDELIADFFDAVERACAAEGVAFSFIGEMGYEDGYEADELDGSEE